MRKFLILISIIFIFEASCLATGQTGDLLIFNKDTFVIYQYPLDKFYNKGNFYNPGFFGELSSACWRGYIAVWIIKDEKLYLKDIFNCMLDSSISIDKIGKNKDNLGLILADWFDGRFIVNMRTKKEFVDSWNFGRIFTRKIDLKIEKGKIDQ